MDPTRPNTPPTSTGVLPDSLCQHTPTCPSAESPDREAARVVAAHPEQGWSLLCNAVLLFEDTGKLLPDGQVVAPHRPTDLRRTGSCHLVVGGTARSGKTAMAASARPA
ncbi:DUF5999 family protein [Streptomyces californicus]|uniref:DUF5999 family protein n=1 Tax=Streptomyces californicus TaxID=67351 RepID=UPI003797DE3E